MGMFLLLFIAQQRKEQKCPQLIVLTKESCSYGCHPINQIMNEHDWHPDFFFFPQNPCYFSAFIHYQERSLIIDDSKSHIETSYIWVQAVKLAQKALPAKAQEVEYLKQLHILGTFHP